MPVYKRTDGYAVYDINKPEEVVVFSTRERALLYESYKAVLANQTYAKAAKRIRDYDDNRSSGQSTPNSGGRGDTWSDDRPSYDDYGPMGPSRSSNSPSRRNDDLDWSRNYPNPKSKKKKSKAKKAKPKAKPKKVEKKANDIWDTL